jgi:phosphoserine phosphatase
LTDSFATPSQFHEAVLATQPALAVFDCDGTLWSGDSGRDFFYWEIERGLVGREATEPMLERYRLYEVGEIDEYTMCAEMVTMNRGVAIADLERAARKFFDEIVAPRIFPDMLALTHRLAAEGCELWAVSSTNNWVVEAGVERFGIPARRVLAACVRSQDGLATGEIIRVPTDALKATAIREVIRRPVDGVFGNSVHDQAMLETARSPFAVNPNPDLRSLAEARNWPVYWPDGTAPSLG